MWMKWMSATTELLKFKIINGSWLRKQTWSCCFCGNVVQENNGIHHQPSQCQHLPTLASDEGEHNNHCYFEHPITAHSTEHGRLINMMRVNCTPFVFFFPTNTFTNVNTWQCELHEKHTKRSSGWMWHKHFMFNAQLIISSILGHKTQFRSNSLKIKM